MKNPIRWMGWALVCQLFLFVTCLQAQNINTPSDEWLILGPIPVVKGQNQNVSEANQVIAFKTDYVTPSTLKVVKKGDEYVINQDTFIWKTIVEQDHIVNLHAVYDTVDFACVYGYKEIHSTEEKEVLLGVGSDDGVKVWLNGNLVHENWVPRGITLDEDIVKINLQKGTNRLLVKVQDMSQEWGFSCRVMNPEILNDKLSEVASKGQYDNVKQLLGYQVDVNTKNSLGITPLQAAKIAGRKEIVDYLIENGAEDISFPSGADLADAYFEQKIGQYQPEPGLAVLISQDGEILYEKAFGMANMEKDMSNTIETKFRIGSITKQFTASAILKLNEDGVLHLDDKLSKYIPDYPRGDEVTIHHLLTHTSGINNYTNKIDFESDDISKPIKSVEDHIASFKNDPYNFDPGENWSYSNSGYFLLGYIIEQVSGMEYGDYLEKTFFKPLKMKNTGVHYGDINLKHEAIGYAYKDGKVELAPNWEMTWAGGAGALYSTVEDLNKWNEGVFNGKLLNEESMKRAFTPVILNNGQPAFSSYGYGWAIGVYRGWETVSHSGGLPGFISYLIRFPKKKITVAVLANATPQPRINPNLVANELAQFFFWKEMDLQPTFKANQEVKTRLLQDYVGRYAYPQGMILNVTIEGDQLFAKLGAQPKFEIFPRGDDAFFWKVVDAQVNFVRDETGKVVEVVHHQNGQTFKAPLMEETSEIAVNSEDLEKYVGVYNLNGQDATFSKDSKKLWIQVAGQPKFQLYAKSKSRFFLKEVNAELEFIENNEGEVNKVILHQAGHQIEMNRKK